jgi:hypothetical protein
VAHGPEMTATVPPVPPVVRMALSAAAERMRLHRERRRNGMRCVTIEVRESEINMLVHMKLLKSEMRNDANAIIEALYAHLDRTLD